MKKPSLALVALSLSLGTTASFAAPASEIWTGQCAKCHGTDGAGKTNIGKKLKLKDYSDAKVQGEMKDEEMTKAIMEGVKDGEKERMKGFTDLSADDVKGLVAYIRTLKK